MCLHTKKLNFFHRGNEKVLKIERRNTRSHYLENSLGGGCGSVLKDYAMTMMTMMITTTTVMVIMM